MPPLLLSRPNRVAGPLAICPKCGSGGRWRSYFADWQLDLNCDACGHVESRKPPVLDKLVVYLDQWAISELANSLDPVLRATKKSAPETVWMELYHAVEFLVKAHAAACPVSPIHRKEGLVTPYAGVLQDLHEHLACGVRFKEPLFIHARQLCAAFDRALLRESADGELPTPTSDALDGRLNEWADDVRISARVTIRGSHIAAENAERLMADKHLGDDSLAWQRRPGRSYNDWYAYHRRDLTNVVLTCWERGFFGVYSEACESMVRRAERHGTPHALAVDTVRGFLHTDEATRVPYCDISSLLFAGISKKIADEGQKTLVDHSHHNDIHAIAAYLPYCDVICVDNYFRELLNKPDIRHHIDRYSTLVFSPNSRSELLQWLRDAAAALPDDLLNTVRAVYGESWLRPYETILEYSRSRGH